MPFNLHRHCRRHVRVSVPAPILLAYAILSSIFLSQPLFAQPQASAAEPASFLFVGDNTTTYVFRGRELQRRQTEQAPPTPDELRPLPQLPVTDAAGILSAQCELRLQQQIDTLRSATGLDLFVLTASESSFEDSAWDLLETLRHGVQAGAPAILVFSEDPTRSAVLFGAIALIKFGKMPLQQITDQALTTPAEGTPEERIEIRATSLTEALAKPPAETDPGFARSLLYARSEQPGSNSESDGPGSTAETTTATATEGESAISSPQTGESQLWQMASFVLIAILLPTAIIATAIVAAIARKKGSSAARESGSQPPLPNPVEPKPLSASSGIPERRVSRPSRAAHLAGAAPLDTLPRGAASPHADPPAPVPPVEFRAPTAYRSHAPHPLDTTGFESLQHNSSSSSGISPGKRHHQSSHLESVTFAPGERDKIQELLATIKLLQHADDDTRREILDMVRSLVSEIKQLNIAPRDGQIEVVAAADD